ncbi:MAG: hypothetical protein HRT72_04135 [Flavobacteriales bacterium]|nr:hypothetical protein [Flavobacteriales bacterium]
MKEAITKVQAYFDYEYSTEYLFANAKEIQRNLPTLDNSNWYGKEDVFDLGRERDEVPYNSLFVENYVRIYELNKDSLIVINGVNSEITISSENKKDIVIHGNSKTTFKGNSTDNYFVVVDSNTIRLPVIPWVSVY